MLDIGFEFTGVLMDNASGLQEADPIYVDTNVLGMAFHRLIRRCG